MVIQSNEIKSMLSQLAKKLINREDAQLWAIKYREAYDENKLKFYPIEDENKIWDALQFIELYAERIDEQSYLYTESDLYEYLKSDGWELKEI